MSNLSYWGRRAVAVALVGLLGFTLYEMIAPAPALPHAQVRFPGATFTAEVARTPAQQRRGLQGRRRLAPRQGMLFVLPGDSLIGFWMKDTLIALDMIWLNRDLEVFHIEGSVPPCHADPCPVYGPKTPAKYVLEIKSGETQRAHIEVGDKASIAAIPDAGAAGLPRHGVDPWRAKGSLILTAH